MEDGESDESNRFGARLFIHAKEPESIESSWVRSKLIKANFRPPWNSMEVVRAMLSVVKEACQDENVGRIILATESCIPLYKMREFGEKIFLEEKSWLSAYHQPKNRWEAEHCFGKVNLATIPREVSR